MNVVQKVPRCLQTTIRRMSLHGIGAQEKESSSHMEPRDSVLSGTRRGTDEPVSAAASTGTCPVSSTEKHCMRTRQKSNPKSEKWTNMFSAISAAKKGKLHIFLNQDGLNEQSVSRLQLLSQKCVSLNKTEAVLEILSSDEASSRVCPFFQHYVFEHQGFAFEPLTERTILQKHVLKSFLAQALNDMSFYDDVEQLKTSLVRDVDMSVDEYLRDCLGNIFSRMLVGEPFPDDGDEKETPWGFVDVMYTLLEQDSVLRAMPFLRHVPGKYRTSYTRAIRHRDKCKQLFFDSQKASFVEGRTRGLIDACLNVQASALQGPDERTMLTDQDIQGIMFDSLLAGLAEMLKSLRMLVLLLCHHGDVQTRVQNEIDVVLGPGEVASKDSVARMPYTQAVILEMLRYVSQTPVAIPHLTDRHVTLGDHVLHKHTLIIPNLWGIHHDEVTWGDPWVFRPERFLDDQGQLLPDTHKCRSSLIPFLIGSRRCPGESFAMLRLHAIVTSLLRDVTFLPPRDEALPSPDTRLYNNKYPLYLPRFKCRVTKRQSDTNMEHGAVDAFIK